VWTHCLGNEHANSQILRQIWDLDLKQTPKPTLFWFNAAEHQANRTTQNKQCTLGQKQQESYQQGEETKEEKTTREQ
jgi:hypothetical protein